MADEKKTFFFLKEHVDSFSTLALSYKVKSLSLLEGHFTGIARHAEPEILLLCEIVSASVAMLNYSNEIFREETLQDGQYAVDSHSLRLFTQLIKVLMEAQYELKIKNIFLEEQ